MSWDSTPKEYGNFCRLLSELLTPDYLHVHTMRAILYIASPPAAAPRKRAAESHGALVGSLATELPQCQRKNNVKTPTMKPSPRGTVRYILSTMD